MAGAGPVPGAPGPAAAADLPPSLRQVRRAVALGDSLTERGGERGGYLWWLGQYVRALYPAATIELVNAGVGGHTAVDLEARFRQDVLDRRPDLVTINVGVNDVWRAFFDFERRRREPAGDLPAGVPLPRYRASLETMVRAARAAGLEVLLIAPTVVSEDLAAAENVRLAGYAAAMREVAARHRARFVDAHAAFRAVLHAYQQRAGRGTNLLTTDGVHLNEAGGRLMAHTILLGLGVPPRDLGAARLRP